LFPDLVVQPPLSLFPFHEGSPGAPPSPVPPSCATRGPGTLSRTTCDA
jgi:hypothetical protein